MKTANFTYHRPESIDGALALLSKFGDDAKVFAGGQSLLPIMNMRLAEPEHLIDIVDIPELRRARETAAGMRYGAAVTHMMIEDELVPDVTGGLLREAASGIGYRAIRTKGTVGGSLAHSDSSAEWPTVMAALNAQVHIRSATRGSRTMPVREFLQGFFTTALQPDELLTAVEVPAIPPGTDYGLYKLARRVGDFAESLAVVFTNSSGLEIWLGAARDTPTRLEHTERWIGRRSVDELTVADLAAPISVDLDIDPSTSAPEKRHSVQLHAAALQRALTATEKVEMHG